MLGLFKYAPIAILSNSMSPTIKRGDIVIYEKNTPIKNGDIIVYQINNQNIVHRVVNNYANLYITKGDANNTADKIKITEKNIKGVYKFHLKYLGYPSIWLNELLNGDDLYE